MNYEQFLANAECALNDCREMKETLSAVQAALSAVPDMVRKNERLEKENAELKGELEILQCIQWPTGYMELPLDADGVPIRIGDEVNVDGDAMTVLGYRLRNDMLLLIAEDKKSGLCFNPGPSGVRHFKPEPADSWEKLEEDAAKEVCAYAGAPFSIVDQDRYSCTGCRFDDCSSRKTSCWLQMNSELMARAKRLAGAE